MRAKRLTEMALLTAVAVTVFVIEAQIPPPVPVVGVKLGISNVVTLIALVRLGRREAGLILAARIFLGSLFSGLISSLIFSASGGILAFLVMALTYRRFPEQQLWVISIWGALAHNAGQLCAAALVMGTGTVFVYYAPPLVVSSIITGAFTGLCARLVIRRLAER